MTKKPKAPPDDPEQSARFIEAAKIVETGDNRKPFEQAIKKLVKQKATSRRR